MNTALHYLRMGFSVIPLEPRGKKPLIQWAEYQKRLATEDEVRGWWAKTPDANIGIVTGKVSGIGVVDLDGPEGIAEGMRLGLTSPLISITGRGRQLFYRHTGENICNSVKTYPGVDVRGDGGYVAVSPSIHPSGKRYQWVGSVNNGSNHLPLFPKALFQSTSQPGVLPSTGWATDALDKLDKGNLHDTTIRLLGKFRAKNFTKEEARAFLLPHILRVGGSIEALDTRINDVYGRYEAGPEPQTEQPSEDIENFMAALTPVDWICRPLIASGTLGFVAGLPETNKTWLLMDLALECARPNAGKWLNLFPVGHTRVLFIDQERFKGETQRRFRGMMAAKGLEPKDFKDNLFIRCGTTTRLDITPSYEAFRRELLTLRPGLVIIDSWAAFQSSDENNRQSVQIVLERIKSLRTEIGATIIFIDHDGKGAFGETANNETTTYRYMAGSIAKPAAAETIFTVRRFDENTVLVHHTKSSLASTVKSFSVRVIDTELGVKVVGQ